MSEPTTPTLFTIGHSNHPVEEFVRLLGLHQVSVVCDVRSQPYSRYNPQFNREALVAELTRADIAYVYLGRELGARVDDPACYEGGRVSYDRVARSELFQEGIDRLHEGMLNYRLTLMCAEKDPITCHRTILVTRRLRDEPFEIQHILADGSVESNREAERRLVDVLRMPRQSLFQTEDELIQEAYARQGNKISYAPTESEDVSR